jgi:ubiquinone/menaquinone biosynthesis C-methylase UbiE
MQKIKEEVLNLYMSHPFPMWDKKERRHRLSAELCRYRFLGLENAMPGAKLLEIGCGTGNRTMLAAKHFGVEEFTGFDQSRESLKVAKQVAREENFEKQFNAVEGDLFNLPFEDNSFDVVVSWGVLHHTSNPFLGFKEATRVLKPGGYIGIFLYNKFNHWRHNLQKNKVSRMAGANIEDRFNVAHQLYGKKDIMEMTPEDIAVFYDQYCHPHKSDHTVGETLAWFEKLGLVYQGSYPALNFNDLVPMLKYRSSLRGEFPLRSGFKLSWILDFLDRLRDDPPKSRYRKPFWIEQFLWQLAYAWIGRHGDYSQGPALSARKK